jgi:hypothetical protein
MVVIKQKCHKGFKKKNLYGTIRKYFGPGFGNKESGFVSVVIY